MKIGQFFSNTLFGKERVIIKGDEVIGTSNPAAKYKTATAWSILFPLLLPIFAVLWGITNHNVKEDTKLTKQTFVQTVTGQLVYKESKYADEDGGGLARTVSEEMLYVTGGGGFLRYENDKELEEQVVSHLNHKNVLTIDDFVACINDDVIDPVKTLEKAFKDKNYSLRDFTRPCNIADNWVTSSTKLFASFSSSKFTFLAIYSCVLSSAAEPLAI